MEEDSTRQHCISVGRSSSLQEVTVRISCFGLGRKKAKPIAFGMGATSPTWKASAALPVREDSTADATQFVGDCCEVQRPFDHPCGDASPRSWGYKGDLLDKGNREHFEPNLQAEILQQQSSDDEGTQSEAVSDEAGALTVHDSTSSLKEGLHVKTNAEILAGHTVQTETLDEEEEDSYLQPQWEIDPHSIFFCSRSNGKLCRLGKGAFGTVYKGVWENQTVAVKVCRQQHITTKAMKQFQKEVAILYGCNHPSIVEFKGACCWKGGKRTVLVTEYMEKGDLCTALGRAPSKFSWNRLGKGIALDVVKGLAFLHAANIVHFDLKSANILLDKENNAKLADVGLAKTLTQYHGRDHLSTFMATGDLGTFAWAAPEVLLGFPCDSKADIFSFGIVMWELATTEMPQGRCLRPIRVPEEVSEEVADLIMDCLRHDPAARPTAQQLVDVLTNLV